MCIALLVLLAGVATLAIQHVRWSPLVRGTEDSFAEAISRVFDLPRSTVSVIVRTKWWAPHLWQVEVRAPVSHQLRAQALVADMMAAGKKLGELRGRNG